MCGGFVVSYTTKNAIKGHKSFKQHLVYGGSTVISYGLIGGLFGLIGGIIAYFVLRQDAPKKAKNCLYLGIVLAIIGVILNILILTQIPDLEQNFNINT